MKPSITLLRAVAVALFLTWTGAADLALAQSRPLYVPLPDRAKGALYLPDKNPKPAVGLLNVHRTASTMSSAACSELARRGFAMLCISTRFENNEAAVDWDKLALDVKAGVQYLKNTVGVSKVVLYGHSGGGATVSFYQAVAEAGVSYCQGANKLAPCENSLADLPRADGVIVIDAHPAIAVNALRAINPAVIDESRPDVVRPDLDPFNPANGFNSNGPSKYSEEFKKRYTEAQARRLNQWIDHALLMRDLIQEGKWIYPDNDSIIIPRAADRVSNLFSLDTSILCCTKQPHKLLQNDGTIVTQVIKSVRQPMPELSRINGTFSAGARILTITSFLSANAIRATDSLDYTKIDWCSTNNSVPCAVRQITVPLLIVAMGAHYFISDSEYYLENAKSADKDFITIAGATHGITPCGECPGGPYNNSQKNFFDYLAQWMNARFSSASMAPGSAPAARGGAGNTAPVR
jgi:pimeloyl-ACP methyl ester carboxylesterase